MSNFANVVREETNKTKTENGGNAYKSTRSALLDLFGVIGGMRDRSEDVVDMYRAARSENKELADNLILYTRDIRNGGIGERELGRLMLRELSILEPEKVIRNFDTIVCAGRWDDLLVFFDTPVEKEMIGYIVTQLTEDLQNAAQSKPISLLVKWLPSINTSSKETVKLAKRLCKTLGVSEKVYRKTLSSLRKYLNIIECNMSSKKWEEIDFSKVPALAMQKYKNAFYRNCEDKFIAYKEALQKGETKVNAGTLYPYDIIKKCFDDWSYDINPEILDEIDIQQWNNLPNYVDESYNVLVMADVSGSMYDSEFKPIATSIGLATYFAQRNKGAYHNIFMTFTNDAHFLELKDEWDLKKCIKYVAETDMGFNTNLDRAFNNILTMAKASKDLPKALVIISDEEIDRFFINGNDEKTYDIIEKWTKEYEKEGFELPKVIFWNVASRETRFLAKPSDKVAFVSGYGVSSFSHLNELINFDAYSAMVAILTKEQFTWI